MSSAFAASVLLQQERFWLAGIPGTLVLVASLAEFVVADILTEKMYPSTTAAMLEKIQDNLTGYQAKITDSIRDVTGSLRGCDRSRVSGTFHLAVEMFSVDGDREKVLLQVVSYSGALGGRRWRFTPITKGLVGRCVRSGRREHVNFASEAEYLERMVSEFGFTSAEVQQHTRAARSYIAEPVSARGTLVGVLYMFSTEPQVFPHSLDTHTLRSKANEISSYLEGSGLV